MIKWRMGWARKVVRMGKRNMYRGFGWKAGRKETTRKIRM
jgi:hypothetical protein